MNTATAGHDTGSDASWLYAALVDRMSKRLSDPLPGYEAQILMAPHYRATPEKVQVGGKSCREAGVLVLVVPEAGVGSVVLTVRRAHLNQHAGQISFPGGRREDGEDLLDTALREAHEEIAVEPEQVDVIGRLTPLYIPPSNFCVYPYVGVCDNACLRAEESEVEEVLVAPLDELAAPEARRREPRTIAGRTTDIPFLHFRGHKIWGATAMMLAELLTVVE